ncbi:MAG: ABC transporter substrate-binding protein, partial [Verrucomicrobiota bacterium]
MLSCRVLNHAWKVALLLSALFCGGANAAEEPPAPDPDSNKPYQIAVFVSSQEGSISTTIDAIKRFLEYRARELNRDGGILDTPVKLTFFDDHENAEETKARFQEALGEERLIAMLGLWSSSRGSGITDLVGQSGVPFISEISLDQLFRDHENIFTLTTSVSDDIDLFQRFLSDNFTSVQFVGVNDDLFTLEFHNALEGLKDELEIMEELWVESKGDISKAALDQIIASIRERKPSILCMAAGSFRGGVILQALAEAGIETPVYFATGTIQRVLRNLQGIDYNGALYQNGTDIPYVDNERLAQLRRHPDFGALGDNYSNDDLAYGLIYSDMLAMIADAATGAPDLSPAGLQSHIGIRLREIKAGQQVYEGLWRNWSFTESRAVSQDKVLHWRPRGSQTLKLFPEQYQAKVEGLSQVPVVYLNIDMEQIRSVDSMEKTFDADFYVSMTSDQKIELEDFEFTNAYRSSGSGAPLIAIRNLKTTRVPGSKSSSQKLRLPGCSISRRSR